MFIRKVEIAFCKAVVSLFALYSLQASANTWLDLDESEAYTARHEASFVQAGNRFYIFGGRENPQVVDTYDYVQNVWTQSASAPIPFNHFQATEYQGLIWVIGAFRNNSFPNETPAANIYTFDPANNFWLKGREIPSERRRGSTGLVEYQGKFYVVGGNTIGHNGGYVPWFDVYNPLTATWTALPDAPSARDHFHATVANDKLYVAGGRLSGGPGGTFAPLIATVDVYDFANSSWSTLPASGNLPTPRAGTSTVTFEGNVIVIGGEGNGQAYDTVEQLNPLTNLWTEIASMNHARHGSQAIVSGNGIFTAVGSPNQGGGRQLNMEAFNSSTPVGVAAIPARLGFEAEEVLVTSSEPIAVELRHIDGNQGAMITSIELSGNNAASFALTEQTLLPTLVAVNGSSMIMLRADTEVDGEFTSLRVTYNNGETVAIPVRTQFDQQVVIPIGNLLINGSFEGVDLADRSFLITQAFDGWQKNGDGSAEFWRSGFLGVPAQDGNTFSELDVGRNTVDSLSQNVTTVAGQTYGLSLYLRARPNSSSQSNGLIVLWNDVQVGAFDGSSDWSEKTIKLVGTGFDRLELRESSAANDGLGTHIDNISLVASSETPELISNLSLGQSDVAQSSTRFSGEAGRAVDGNTSGRYRDSSVTHTANTFQPWWQVDLSGQANIDRINVFNRTDTCCTSRLSNFYVLLSNEPFGNRSLSQLLADESVVNSFHSALTENALVVNFDNAQGRYLRIQLRDSGVLSLAEVEVMGRIND